MPRTSCCRPAGAKGCPVGEHIPRQVAKALTAADQAMLEQAMERLQLSARSMHRILRVARTIADLAGGGPIERTHLAEEMGDLLFVVANLARHLNIDPEEALRAANAKFTRRFRSIEATLASQGRRPEDSTLEEMDALWDAAKAAERR